MIFYEQKSIVTCLTTGWSPLLSNGATEQAIRMISALRQGSCPPCPQTRENELASKDRYESIKWNIFNSKLVTGQLLPPTTQMLSKLNTMITNI